VHGAEVKGAMNRGLMIFCAKGQKGAVFGIVLADLNNTPRRIETKKIPLQQNGPRSERRNKKLPAKQKVPRRPCPVEAHHIRPWTNQTRKAGTIRNRIPFANTGRGSPKKANPLIGRTKSIQKGKKI